MSNLFEIDTVKFKNLMSFGNAWTTVNFKSGTSTLVHGKNGAGKSTIYEAVFLCLFGKPFRKIKKGSLTNWVNEKDCQVEITGRRNGDAIQIFRSVSPSTIKIWINGNLKDQEASNRDPQEWLEKSVIGMSERTFRQIVILGSRSYVPFMSLAAGDRRAIVEDILGLGVYAEMLDSAKKRMTAVTKSVSAVRLSCSNLDGRIEELTKSVNRMKGSTQSSIDDLNGSLADAKRQIEETIESGKETAKNLVELKGSLREEERDEIRKSLQKIDELCRFWSRDIESARKSRSFFDEHKDCPTCLQEISEEFRQLKISEYQATESTLTEKVQRSGTIHHKLKLKLDPIEKIESDIRNLKTKLNGISESVKVKQNQEKFIASAIQRLKETTSSDLEKVQATLDSVSLERSSIKIDLERYQTELQDLDSLVKSLRDDGVKARVIKDYLPMINRLISKHLKEMDLKISFRFDDQFDEKILVRGKQEYAYESFSTGERLRIDLSLLFAWREIAVLRGSSGCNLVVFDEIGGASLDPDGFSCFVRTIEKARNGGDCVVVISHQPDLLSDRCDRILSVSKDGFSKIEESADTREAVLT